jgi:hypothetical protein
VSLLNIFRRKESQDVTKDWNVIIHFNVSCANCREEFELDNYSSFGSPQLRPIYGEGFFGPAFIEEHFIKEAIRAGWTSMADQDGDAYAACPNCVLVWIGDRLEVISKQEYAELARSR